MSPAREKLPKYLEKYISTQNYDQYTSRDHAAWRYIMRQNREFFRTHAVSIYIEGLKKTGIPLDRIPRISDMDECLAKFGWGAVPVRGFIPPAAFLDFQARGVLPIACDMRSVQHIAYTPAPDIVHEAAGHAPIIADPAYAKYLHRYAAMAQRAIASIDDIRTYEAIRYLSDIKENPDTKPAAISQAEARLKEVSGSIQGTSETTKVTRMAWWTVEYGLLGDIRAPKIYGAGLLSSVGESQNCLSYKVRKVPLTVDCVYQSYDITEPQPQLFVTPTLEHLVDVLEDLESTLAFRIGGKHALDTCVEAKTVNTIELDSGLQISGEVHSYHAENDAIRFVKLSGPVQLCCARVQLHGHGPERHPTGFSSPLGRWKQFPDRPTHTLSRADLETAGCRPGNPVQIDFVSGYQVKGTFKTSVFHESKLVCLTFTNCTVTRGQEVLFAPEWGEFDLAIGERVVSAYGGPADISHFGDFDIGEASTSPARTSPFTHDELSIFGVYSELRKLRRQTSVSAPSLEAIAQSVLQNYASEWLLELELLEIAKQHSIKAGEWTAAIETALARNRRDLDPPAASLIDKGLEHIHVPD
jgi:phenylalanine-4-hydroxylase